MAPLRDILTHLRALTPAQQSSATVAFSMSVHLDVDNNGLIGICFGFLRGYRKDTPTRLGPISTPLATERIGIITPPNQPNAQLQTIHWYSRRQRVGASPGTLETSP